MSLSFIQQYAKTSQFLTEIQTTVSSFALSIVTFGARPIAFTPDP